MSRRAAWLAVVVCLGCADDGSELEQATLGIEASDGNGQRGLITCEALPLLQGSRSYENYVIDDLVTLLVTAEPGQISVRFQSDGRSVAKTLTIPRSALLHGFSSNVALQPLPSGEKYTIHLSSECPP
jgi:hypothetical protein